MKTVACYCRVSTEEQVKYGFSIQAQKDALIKYCKENDYKYDFYIDEGISASSMKKRKALQKMLEKSVAYDMILFTKLDRLSRNVLDANNINKILQDNNCTMKAIDEDVVEKVFTKENVPTIFAGMLYCYYCKSRLVRKIDYRSKNKNVNYYCDKQYKYKVGINEKQCQNSRVISDKSVEEYLINNLKDLCKQYISKSRIKTKPKPQKNNIKINSLKNKLSKLKDLYLDDLISKEDYKQDYIRINKEILKLEEEQKEEPQKDFTYLNELINKDIPDIYNTFNIEEKRKFWLKIIDKIYIKEGKIKEVTFL